MNKFKQVSSDDHQMSGAGGLGYLGVVGHLGVLYVGRGYRVPYVGEERLGSHVPMHRG